MIRQISKSSSRSAQLRVYEIAIFLSETSDWENEAFRRLKG